MSKKNPERLSPIEVAYIIVAFAIVIASLSYVILVNYDRTPSGIEVDFNGYDGGYDISVINRADVDDFIQINGIGEVKASEIVAYRDALGGFENVYQLLDVKSVTAELFEAIIMHFYFSELQPSEDLSSDKDSDIVSEPDEVSDESVTDPSEDGKFLIEHETASNLKDDDELTSENDTILRQSVNINTASADEIAVCLLLSSDQADQIVEIRELIGGYSNVSELALCSLISEDLYSEIKNYIDI